MVTFSKFPCYFIACVTDQICACDTEEGEKKNMFLKFHHILSSMTSYFSGNLFALLPRKAAGRMDFLKSIFTNQIVANTDRGIA